MPNRGMFVLRTRLRQLGEFDLVERLGQRAPEWLVQLVFGVLCTAAGSLVRVVVDIFSPAAGPFSLIYPTILIATLYGRLGAGLVTWATSFLYVWYAVLPEPMSFAFSRPADGPRTLINGVSALVIVLFAETFRLAVRRAVRERDDEIALRDLLLREIDHRMKNNFAIVASLLDLQGRRQNSVEAREALAAASARVHSFAAAHESLYRSGDLNDVAMADYLSTLSSHVVAGMFAQDRVSLRHAIADVRMPRDQAVSIGLVLNEVVTNAAKHAFGPDGSGEIVVTFEETPGGWVLTVEDDGRGMQAKPGKKGLGTSLIESFATRAGGEVAIKALSPGTRVEVRGSRNAATTGA